MTLDEVAAELYGLPPAEFVAARTERAQRARAAADKTLASAIEKLRRPTAAAQAVNLLARAAPEDVHALLELGEQLREAQRRLSGVQLRTLSTQRQQLINAVARRAAELATAAGRPPSDATLRDIGTTLHAALADAAVADHVRAGTLATAASYEGFGPAATTSGPAADTAEHRGAPSADPPQDKPARSGPAAHRDTPSRKRVAADSRREQARRELEQALADIETARAAVTSAATDHDSAAAELAGAQTRVTGLRAELAEAEDQRRTAATAERRAAVAPGRAAMGAGRATRRAPAHPHRRPLTRRQYGYRAESESTVDHPRAESAMAPDPRRTGRARSIVRRPESGGEGYRRPPERRRCRRVREARHALTSAVGPNPSISTSRTILHK
ncbi:hypothetical protein [Nocardia sp. alder85J]|uniref:hypothetical protein n=1 Tax=Nocardia sp. alder85J TaxID=2862949 RepID=UPI001CD5CD88|nr:hypothetical protein [Nocardia sp. alder85J]MCX4090975.1 hypothetical protein [Nocardia sp. alder85J]